MKLLMMFILLLSLESLAMGSMEPDKIKHRTLMFLGTSAMYTALRASGKSIKTSLTLSVFSGIMVGHIKESTDEFYDTEDMVANMEGIGLAMIFPIIDWSF